MYTRKTSTIRTAVYALLGIIAVIFLAGFIIIHNPYLLINVGLKFENYRTVVEYYNKFDFTDEQEEKIDLIINAKIDEIYRGWEEYDISYDEAKSILACLQLINNNGIKERIEKDLLHMEIENTGDKALESAEIYLGDEEYLQAMKCLDEVDVTYSNYKTLEGIYDVSKKVLLDDIGTPATKEDYNNAIDTLAGYIQVVADKDFINEKDRLEQELAEYKAIHLIINDAAKAYENGDYKSAFENLSYGNDLYPESNKLKYAISAFQYAYILTVSAEVEILLSEEDYEGAIDYLKKATNNYDCEEFKELLDAVKRKDSVLYNIGATLSDFGGYVFGSAKKIVLGDFAEDEEETLLSLGGNIAASVTGVDTPLDVRDLAYDISHWGEGDYFAARFALDVVGVIPIIGSVKYIKHIDTAVDALKVFDKIGDSADTVHDVVNAADAAHDAANVADSAHDAINVADMAHDAANAADSAHDISNAAESADDIRKQIKQINNDVIEDVTKKADSIPDLADDFSDVTKKVDKAEDIADTAKDAAKKGGRRNDIFSLGEGELYEVHHIPADSVTGIPYEDGPAIKMDKEDHRRTASCGSSREAREYRKRQKELIQQGHFKEAVQMDIDDIQKKFGDKYDDAIEEMIEYMKEQGWYK